MRKYFKRLIVYSTIEILSLNISYVNGDVFELQQNIEEESKNIFVENEGAFRIFISENKSALPEDAKDPFTGDAANATQMLGYAVFFPEGNTVPQKVYVAKKREYVDEATPITDYKNVTSIEDFRNSTKFDHTERQLLSRILIDYNIGSETKGVICIYTYAPPCRREVIDNKNLCCVDYYKKFLQKNLNIELKIYFADKRNILDGDFKGDFNFCEGLAASVQQLALFSINLKLGEKLVQIGNVDDDPIYANNISFGKCRWRWSKRQLSEINGILITNATQSFNNIYNYEQNLKLQFNAI